MSVLWKKMAREKDPVPVRKVCAVTDCDEAATRTFNSSHKGFAARLCPCHQRLVAALPFMHLCQYNPSLIDNKLQCGDEVRFIVFPFISTSAGSADLPPDNAEGPKPCVNRATQIVLVGEHAKDCTLYLLCHGHCVQAAHKYSGPVEDKHYMTTALPSHGNQSMHDRPTIPEKIRYLKELDLLILQKEANKAMDDIPSADDAIPLSFWAGIPSNALAVNNSPVKEVTNSSSPTNVHPANSQSVKVRPTNDQSGDGDSDDDQSGNDCFSDSQYNSAKSTTNTIFSEGDEVEPTVQPLVTGCDVDDEIDAKLGVVLADFEKRRISELKIAIRCLRAALEAPQDHKDLDKMTEAELGVEFTQLWLTQPDPVNSNYDGPHAINGLELEDHVYDSGTVSAKPPDHGKQDIRLFIHVWNWFDSWCDWRLFRYLVPWPLEILGAAWALLLWLGSSRKAEEKREQPRSRTPAKVNADSKVNSDPKVNAKPKVNGDSKKRTRPRTPAVGIYWPKEHRNIPSKVSGTKTSCRPRLRERKKELNMAQLERQQDRRIKLYRGPSMEIEPKREGPEKHRLKDEPQLPVVNGDLRKTSSKPSPQMDGSDSMEHASRPPAEEGHSKGDDIKKSAQEDASKNRSQADEEPKE